MRVILADDAVLLREGLARILGESGFEVVGQVGDGASLVRLVRQEAPDVAVIDIRMPPGFAGEGIDAAAEIRSTAPHVGLMLLDQRGQRIRTWHRAAAERLHGLPCLTQSVTRQGEGAVEPGRER